MVEGFCICIGKDCQAKQALGVTGLAQKVFQAKEVEAVAAEWAEKDPDKTAEQIFITTKWRDREGNERERQVSVSEARTEFYDLQSYLGQCTSCQANVASERFKGGVFSGFGCFIHLDLPITKELEDGLMVGANVLVERAKVDPTIEFLNNIAKEKLTGAIAAQLRAQEPSGIDSGQPQSITFGGFLGKRTVTSDQILERLLNPSTSPEDALLCHYYLERTHDALKERGASFAVRDKVLQLSSIFGTANQVQRPVNVIRGGAGPST